MKEKMNAIMMELAEEAIELLQEAKLDEQSGKMQNAFAKEDIAMTLNYYFNRMREVLENE